MSERPSLWREWFPSFEDRAARRRQRIEDLGKTDSLRARVEIAIGVLALLALVAVIVTNLVR